MAAITVNGKRHELETLGSVADLLERLELKAQHVAVERNREIVPRATYADAQLQDGDQLEIVTFVGGG